MIRNAYEIKEDKTIIFLDKADKSRIECIIDTEDFEKVKNIDTKWHMSKSPTRTYVKSPDVKFTLSSLILDHPKGIIWSKDGNPFNLTKENLEIRSKSTQWSKFSKRIHYALKEG